MDIQASWVHATVAIRNHSSYSPSIDVAAASSFFTRPTGSHRESFWEHRVWHTRRCFDFRCSSPLVGVQLWSYNPPTTNTLGIISNFRFLVDESGQWKLSPCKVTTLYWPFQAFCWSSDQLEALRSLSSRKDPPCLHHTGRLLPVHRLRIWVDWEWLGSVGICRWVGWQESMTSP